VLLPPPSTPASQQENFIKKELRKYQDEELNILPRNNNWDVKKLLEPKLEKLKKRTQKAIVDFLREKLANMSEGSDEEEEGEE
jgi:coiled-coil domain-containing protein 12